MAVRIDDRFIQLINENIGIAHKISRAYFSDAVEREDIVQEMMYQLWQAYARFDGRAKFSTWMYKVCLNTVLSYTRKNRQKSIIPLSHLPQDISEPPAVNRDDDIEKLFEAIAGLSNLNKAIILLYLDDMSYEEIAAVTGLGKSNVSVRLVRIKKELATLLKKTCTS